MIIIFISSIEKCPLVVPEKDAKQRKHRWNTFKVLAQTNHVGWMIVDFVVFLFFYFVAQTSKAGVSCCDHMASIFLTCICLSVNVCAQYCHLHILQWILVKIWTFWLLDHGLSSVLRNLGQKSFRGHLGLLFEKMPTLGLQIARDMFEIGSQESFSSGYKGW